MNRQKIIKVSSINRIKYEALEDFDESLFSDVYYQASGLVRHIIHQNRDRGYVPDVDFCKDEQLNNVIAFLGERGVGKSSAMLSFALFLKGKDCDKKSRYQISDAESKVDFSVLPRIDVAMMVKGEKLLDVVLARMWDTFEGEYRKQVGWEESSLEEVKEQFRRVKGNYAVYMSSLADERKITRSSSIEELHNLASALNLKDEIKKLVDVYLKCVFKGSVSDSENQYLVLAIDDMDLAVENVYEILEQLRIFLVIPKVIVLITADLDRMAMGCTKYIYREMCSELFLDKEKKQRYLDSRRYVDNYLAKIIPQNMRINMPDVRNLASGEYEIRIENFEKKLYGEDADASERKWDEKNIVQYARIRYATMILILIHLQNWGMAIT